MKKIILLVAIISIPLIGLSQLIVNTEVLDENNMGVTLSDGGVCFAQPNPELPEEFSQQMFLPGLEYPKGSGKNIMRGLAMWFTGVDENDEPLVSAPTQTAYEDQFSGAISATYLPTCGHGGSALDLFSISKEEIDFHITNYQNPNYVIPEKIAAWPAHGDVSMGLDFYLAPFVDTDEDGYYNPYVGDYPCIKGDRAVYMILNDKRGDQYCAGPRNPDGLGIEMHFMFYQYSSIRELANTTFCNVRVINRSTSNYRKFSSSLFMNAELGSQEDDYFGTDVQRNVIYAYNGDEVDFEYGNSVPAVGIVSLNKDFNRTRVFGDNQNYGYHFPSYPPEFVQVIQGNLLTGEHFPKRFGFPGNPILGEGDIQYLPEQAHSMIYSIDVGEFNSGDEVVYDFAVVVGQSTDHLSSISRMMENVDFTQNFYEESAGGCVQATEGIPVTIDPPHQTPPSAVLSVYPNPSNGEFTVEVTKEWEGADLTVFSATGLVLHSINNVSEYGNDIQLSNGPGVYLVTLEKNGVTKIIKAVVE